MRRINLLLFVCAVVLIADQGMAQCRGGGATGSLGGGATTASTGVLTSGGGMLTGPGSLAYDMMAAAAMQRQLAQLQMLRYQQQQVARQEKLAKRLANAEKTRLAVLEKRQRTRQILASQNGGLSNKRDPRLLAASQISRY